MAVVDFEIVRRGPYRDGQRFGDVGPYERIEALAHYALDPDATANRSITDLALAARDREGLVRFSGDVTLLVPAVPERANRALLVEVPNRGHRIALRQLNMGPVEMTATATLAPGDGYLFRAGWTVAWCGWQWDVPRSDARIGLEPPYVEDRHDLGGSRMQLRIQPDERRFDFSLTDHHVGEIGEHRSIPPANLDDPEAVLLVRDGIYGEPRTVPRAEWRFGRGENGEPDPEHVWLQGGFEPGRIYDLVYRPRRCPVVGAGLAAVRDLGAFLRAHPGAPTAGRIEHAVAEGISQCGRFLRTFLHLGMNADEAGRKVYDGMLIHVAGGRRGEFNHRFAQPSVQPTPSFGHRFPFADASQVDPRSGRREGLLDRLRAADRLPRIVYTDTSAEYWRGDAGLTHCDLGSGGDVELPEEVRRYLFASTQHGPGGLPMTDRSLFGSRGANRFNIVDYRPLYRAALANLLAWIADGVPPPPSRYPRRADGTAADRTAVLEKLRGIPGLVLPDPAALPALRPLDLGPRTEAGIGEHPAAPAGPPYPVVVSAVDDDGNELAGVRMPDVSVPVATSTGFNPRHPETGGEGQILEYLGSGAPFAPDEAARGRGRDPRPSLAARYAGRDGYLREVRAAARALVVERYLLAEDVETCVRLAAERYDAVAAASDPRLG